MIELSGEQIHVMEKEDQDPPLIFNPHTNEEFVLVRRELFDRLRGLLFDEITTEDAFRPQLESAAAAGWDDPALDIYNDM